MFCNQLQNVQFSKFCSSCWKWFQSLAKWRGDPKRIAVFGRKSTWVVNDSDLRHLLWCTPFWGIVEFATVWGQPCEVEKPALTLTTQWLVGSGESHFKSIRPYSGVATHCSTDTPVWSPVTLSPNPFLEWRTWRGLDHPWHESVRGSAETRVRIPLGTTHSDNGALKPLGGKSNHAHKPETVERSRVGSV